MLLLASGCSSSVGKPVSSVPLPIECYIETCKHSSVETSIYLDSLIQTECPQGHVLLEFDVLDGQFSGDRIRFFCLQQDEVQCDIMVDPGISYSLLVGNQENEHSINIQGSGNGMLECGDGIYRLWLRRPLRAIDSYCHFTYMTNAIAPVGTFANPHPEGCAFRINFRY